MYLKTIRLRNIKCFKELKLDFSEDLLNRDLNKPESVRRWTTLFGKNALGKSTLLQAMGAVLAGPPDAKAYNRAVTVVTRGLMAGLFAARFS